MKNKDIALIVGFFALFAILVFTTPFIENKTSSYIWALFFIIVIAIVLIWILLSVTKTPKEEIIENYKKQPKILQILEIIFIIVFAYELIIMKSLQISLIILCIILLIHFCKWFFKKEE